MRQLYDTLRAHSLSSKSKHGRSRPYSFRPLLEPLEERAMLTTLLPGFSETTVASGISSPTSMEFSPDGHLWVLQQTGQVKFVQNNGTLFTALNKTVDSNGERGMLGIAFDPNYITNHFVYLYYTNPNAPPAGTASWSTGVHNQLSRFTVDVTNPQQPLLTNEAPILDWNTLSGATNHNGGAIHFGTDGMLYANAGDNVQTFTGPDSKTYRVSQSVTTLLGKQLRIDVSKFNSGVATRDDTAVGHLIPSNNPFVADATVTGINKLIYVLGLRNPFTFAVQPGSGRILINDVGEVTWEEVNDAVAGGNYGWSGGNTDGFGNPPPAFALGTYHDPLLAYNHSGAVNNTGIAIVGSTFYNPTNVQFPSSYVGMYFYEDLQNGWIRYFNPNTPNTSDSPDGNSVLFASGTAGGLRDLKVDSAGSLYYLSGGDGAIHKISFTGSQVVAHNLFYNNSKYDGNNAGINAADNSAIATDKSAYLPGSGAATFANVSSYSAGINGLMVDVKGTHGTFTANDFIFRVGNNNSPNTWTTVAAVPTISTRVGAGVGGSDRVEITWPDGSIQKNWLEVIVRGNDTLGGNNTNTKLVTSDVFFYASAVGDDGTLPDDVSTFRTTSTDEIDARNNPRPAVANIPTSNPYDFNRDGKVDSTDQIIARNNPNNNNTAPKIISIAAAGPFAPEASPAAAAPTDNNGIVSALGAPVGPDPNGITTGPPTTGNSPDPPRTVIQNPPPIVIPPPPPGASPDPPRVVDVSVVDAQFLDELDDLLLGS